MAYIVKIEIVFSVTSAFTAIDAISEAIANLVGKCTRSTRKVRILFDVSTEGKEAVTFRQ